MTLRFLPEVFDDLREGFDWYEERLPGLGRSFLLEVEQALDRIGERPRLYAVVESGVRRGRVDRFPYSIFYMLEGSSEVLVIAVHHQSKRPGTWRDRA